MKGARVVAPRGINAWYLGPWGWWQHRIDIALAAFVQRVQAEGSAKGGSAADMLIETVQVLADAWSPPAAFDFPRFFECDSEIPVADPLASTRELGELVEVDSRFTDWKALSIPGHTSHMAALWHPSSQTLYAADGFIYFRGSFQSSMEMDFLSLQVDSVRRLSVLPVRTLLLAHGGRWEVRSSARTDGSAGNSERACKSKVGDKQTVACYSTMMAGVTAELVERAKRPRIKGWRSMAYTLMAFPARMCPLKQRIRSALARKGSMPG